jgi:hypothetical protein
MLFASGFTLSIGATGGVHGQRISHPPGSIVNRLNQDPKNTKPYTFAIHLPASAPKTPISHPISCCVFNTKLVNSIKTPYTSANLTRKA